MDISSFIKESIKEDVGNGDFTTLSTIPEHQTGKAKLLVKEDGVLAGIELAQSIFNEVDNSLSFNKFLSNLNDNDINSFNDDLFSDLSSEYLSNKYSITSK